MSEFQNNPVPEQEFPDFEQLEMQPLSPKYVRVIMFNTLIFSLIILAGTIGGNLFMIRTWSMVNYIVLAAVLLLIAVFFLYQYFAFFRRKYAVREKDIVYQSGLIRRDITIIPFNRIQHSSLEEGWISRILGLKSVTFYTAGSQGSDLRISGLPKETAERMNQLVISKIIAEEEEEEEREEEERLETEYESSIPDIPKAEDPQEKEQSADRNGE